MNIEQAKQLKKEASELIDRLYKMYMGQALPRVKENPFCDTTAEIERLHNILEKAYLRHERRMNVYFDLKFPNCGNPVKFVVSG